MKTLLLFACIGAIICTSAQSQTTYFGIGDHINMRELLKTSRVVCLAEPTHAEGNVFEAKTELVKFLHDSLQFNVIAFESGFYDMQMADYLLKQNPSKNSIEYIASALFPIWTNSQQFKSFLSYFERNKNKITLAGFDYQLTGDYSTNFLVDSTVNFIQKYFPQRAKKIDKELLQAATSAFAEDFEYPMDINYHELQSQMKAIQNIFGKIERNNELTDTERRNLMWYQQSIANLQVLASDSYAKRSKVLDEKTFKAKDSNVRDSMMARNVLELMKLYPNEKIICWGAGPHFLNNSQLIKSTELNQFKSMGMYLKQFLGNDSVFTLTFISSSGQYGSFDELARDVPPAEIGSIEYDFQKIGRDTFISLSAPPYNSKDFVSSCIEYTPLAAPWSSVFDAFYYLNKFCPITLAVDSIALSDVRLVTLDYQLSENQTDSFVSGTVIDSKSRLPISYASISDKYGNYITQCNNKGRFAFQSRMSLDSMVIKADEYQSRLVGLTNKKQNTVKLDKLEVVLNEVIVKANKVDVNQVIKSVVANFQKNYSNKIFSQLAYTNRTMQNFDSVILDLDFAVENYLNITRPKVPKIDFKEVRTNRRCNDILGQIGHLGIPSMNAGDMLRDDGIFKAGRYKRFTFKITSVYTDSTEGLIYKIHYSANMLNRRVTNDYFTKSLEGEIHVRRKDFAVIFIDRRLQRNLNSLQRWTKKYSELKQDDSWRIMPTFEYEYSINTYYQNPKDSIYYTKYANVQWHEIGTIVANNQPVDLYSDYSFYDLGKISVIDDQESIPFSTFRIPSQIEYDKKFWTSFVGPKKNQK